MLYRIIVFIVLFTIKLFPDRVRFITMTVKNSTAYYSLLWLIRNLLKPEFWFGQQILVPPIFSNTFTCIKKWIIRTKTIACPDKIMVSGYFYLLLLQKNTQFLLLNSYMLFFTEYRKTSNLSRCTILCFIE